MRCIDLICLKSGIVMFSDQKGYSLFKEALRECYVDDQVVLQEEL